MLQFCPCLLLSWLLLTIIWRWDEVRRWIFLSQFQDCPSRFSVKYTLSGLFICLIPVWGFDARVTAVYPLCHCGSKSSEVQLILLPLSAWIRHHKWTLAQSTWHRTARSQLDLLFHLSHLWLGDFLCTSSVCFLFPLLSFGVMWIPDKSKLGKWDMLC